MLHDTWSDNPVQVVLLALGVLRSQPKRVDEALRTRMHSCADRTTFLRHNYHFGQRNRSLQGLQRLQTVILSPTPRVDEWC